jgi:hypothetical protein
MVQPSNLQKQVVLNYLNVTVSAVSIGLHHNSAC